MVEFFFNISADILSLLLKIFFNANVLIFSSCLVQIWVLKCIQYRNNSCFIFSATYINMRGIYLRKLFGRAFKCAIDKKLFLSLTFPFLSKNIKFLLLLQCRQNTKNSGYLLIWDLYINRRC